MPSSKPLMTQSSGPIPDSVESALRTLETEGGGINALAAALRGPLGASFAKAVDLIRNAKGRVIVTGLGKSGHMGPQDRGDAGFDRHARLLRAHRRSRPRRPRHDHHR
ncbi:hypothetical protein ACVWW4_006160 [Bradyrhizobium sp. LB7.1]